MTNQAKPFNAVFVNAVPVKTRGVVSFTFEVEVDFATDALNYLGGYPKPGGSVWCGIALMDPKLFVDGKPSPSSSVLSRAIDHIPPTKERRRMKDIPIAEQAGILCSDPVFHRYLLETEGEPIEDDKEAAIWLRNKCGIESRAELKNNQEAAERFRVIHGEFDAWRLVA